MLSFLFYTVMYFVVGFAVAKFIKFYDETNNLSRVDKLSYPTVGIVWLPYLVLLALSSIHKLFKEKL